jgi:acyl-coenzyme A synthetase/AMP-(fatty) acid ligase
MAIEGARLAAPARSLGDVLGAGLESKPDAAALASAERTMSWRELDEARSRLAAGYAGLGLAPGDRIASLMPNRIDLAVQTSGLRRGIVWHGPDGADFAALAATPPSGAPPAADPSAPAAIFFTSGSTGPAKGVTHTLDTLDWMCVGAAAGFELTADDAFLPASSMSHVGAFLWTFASLELEDEFSHMVGFSIDEGYGMTEVGLATLNPPSGLVKRGSIGRPVPGVTIAIRDDEGGEVPPGTTGRIWIRSRSRTVGYWGDPEATAAVVRDGWLDSGDLARADEDGYLWFFGRKKQIIVHDGSNISPLEVEGALAEHPRVALAGVVGVDDAVHGENVRAYVAIAGDGPAPSAAELIAFARERVGYKAPEEVVVLDEMPLNPTGKVDREGLKRLAEEHLHPHGLGDACG